jgi:hypothetical protein
MAAISGAQGPAAQAMVDATKAPILVIGQFLLVLAVQSWLKKYATISLI